MDNKIITELMKTQSKKRFKKLSKFALKRAHSMETLSSQTTMLHSTLTLQILLVMLQISHQ